METVFRKDVNRIITVLSCLFILLLSEGFVFRIIMYDRNPAISHNTEVLEKTSLSTKYLISPILSRVEIDLLVVENWISANPGSDPRIVKSMQAEDHMLSSISAVSGYRIRTSGSVSVNDIFYIRFWDNYNAVHFLYPDAGNLFRQDYFQFTADA
jgi:hypothetical protein